MDKSYAINRTDSNKELTHWKYIKRVKGRNGKWRYYYNNYDNEKYNKQVETYTVEERTTSDGEKVNTKVRTAYEDSNDMFTETDTIVTQNGKYEYNIIRRGKLDRFIAKAEKWVFDKFLTKN